MTVWYVGKGGSDANSGRTWATRLATLNGAEDQPVVAGDTVYVAPGVYRETLTCDVSGAAGSPITYIGDVTGEHTDGVGGPVRITGSDNDTTTTRTNCIDTGGGARNYRTFRGFRFDMTSSYAVSDVQTSTNMIVEDCAFTDTTGAFSVTGTDLALRRCVFISSVYAETNIINLSLVGYSANDAIIENCVIVGGRSRTGIFVNRYGGVVIKNCLFFDTDIGIGAQNLNANGDTATVYNCIFTGCRTALSGGVIGDITENYNTFFGNNTDRTNTNIGANSISYPALLGLPILHSGADQLSGFRFPWWFGSLSRWSQIRQITGSSEPDEDLYGIRRPYTHGGPVAASCSWGPVQWFDYRRSDIRAHDGSLSMRQAEKSASWMFVPGVTATSHTITVRNWRTAGYGGHRNPTMTIKQPGRADRVTEAGGAAGAWVQLSDTFTPAADPPWLVVEMRNNCDFTTTTTVSTTSTSTLSTTSTTTQTVSTLTTTTTTLACDVWWDNLQVA